MQTPDPATAQRVAAKENAPSLRAWYTTVVLMIAYTFSFLDRQVLNLMVGPIKHDYHISDTQFACLTGLAFAFFYALVGFPMGWLADRYPRKWIISGGIALWSLMTAACGATRSYAGLLLARIGVGVGEATLSPSTYSLLPDLFDRTRLPRAMSIYAVGIYIGAGLALILGGTVVSAISHTAEVTVPLFGTVTSWHVVFFIVGLPGLLVALWATTLVEPARKKRAADSAQAGEGLAIVRVWRFLSAYPRMSVALYMGSSILAVMSYMDSWYPELFIRTWHWTAKESGTINGTASLVAGPLGMFVAGWWSARWIKFGKSDACLRVAAYGAAAMAVPLILMPLMGSPIAMAALIFPIKFFGGFVPVLIPSAIQLVCPTTLRAQFGAGFLLVGGVGQALGPLIPAWITDYGFHSDSALRYSLALAPAIVAPLACILLSLGLRQYRERAQAIESLAGA